MREKLAETTQYCKSVSFLLATLCRPHDKNTGGLFLKALEIRVILYVMAFTISHFLDKVFR